MKTKSLILTALLTVAGTAGLMAQSSNVYSQNIVGYVSQAIPAGFSIVTCQLKGSPDNKLTTVMPNPTEGTIIYKWSNAQNRYYINDFADGAWEGDDLNMTLNPGEAVWVKAVSPFTNTFVGEVALSTTNSLPSGFSIVSSAVPQVGTLNSASLGFVPAEGDVIYQWSNSQNRYYINDFADGAWEGDTASGSVGPAVQVGEGFWLKNFTTNRVWTRTITVGP